MRWLAASSVVAVGIAIVVLAFFGPGRLYTPTMDTGPALTPPADPGSLGPYQVGVTRRSFPRSAAEIGNAKPLEVVIWYPSTLSAPSPAVDTILAALLDAEPDRGRAPYPVVVFSHGSGGAPWGVTYLTTHLASHGFVVVAPVHNEIRAGRSDALVTVLDHVSSPNASDDGLLPGLVDGARAGVSGFSLGGDSALRAASKDHRFRAVIAMAPGGGGTGPPSLDEAVSGVVAPAMLMWGMLDDLVSYVNHKSLLDRLGRGATERWLVTLPRAGHGAFADLCPASRRGCGSNGLPQDQAHALINHWAATFLLTHVAGDRRYEALLRRAPADDPEIQVTFTPAKSAGRLVP